MVIALDPALGNPVNSIAAAAAALAAVLGSALAKKLAKKPVPVRVRARRPGQRQR